MDADTLNDLKQFISATISQQLSDVATRDDIARLEGDIARLDRKIDDRTDEILESIGATFTTHGDAIDSQLIDHERRITKLETRAA